jgi:hypothetical protein
MSVELPFAGELRVLAIHGGSGEGTSTYIYTLETNSGDAYNLHMPWGSKQYDGQLVTGQKVDVTGLAASSLEEASTSVKDIYVKDITVSASPAGAAVAASVLGTGTAPAEVKALFMILDVCGQGTSTNASVCHTAVTFQSKT